MNLELLLLGLA